MSIADLKRDLKQGAKVRGAYFIHKLSGAPADEQEFLKAQEWREVVKAQTNSVKIGDSWLDIPPAYAADYDGKLLRIYETEYRALTDEERAALEEWQEMGGGSYIEEYRYFDSKGMLYLAKHDDGRELDKRKYGRGARLCVRDLTTPKDKRERGELIALYEIAK